MTDHRIGPNEAFERWLAEAAPTLNDPPATPREEMWAAIAERRAQGAARGTPRRWQRAWLFPAALAAAAVMGIVLDRAVMREPGRVAAPAPAPVAQRGASQGDTLHGVDLPRVAVNDPPPRPTQGPERATPTREEAASPRSTLDAPHPTLRLAAAQTLAQAELVLAAYRTADTTDARQLGRWAKDVLGSTRLLLDSRVGQDPQLRPLLQDLELVLMQVAQLAGAPLDATERELLDRALKERALLTRLRSAVPAGGAT